MTVPENPDVEVWSPSPEEWETYKHNSLRELGLTYEELQRQAAARDFSSTEAKMLWIVIGGIGMDTEPTQPAVTTEPPTETG